MMTIACDDDYGDHETLDGHSFDGLDGDLRLLMGNGHKHDGLHLDGHSLGGLHGDLDGHSLGGLDSLGGLHGDG